MARTQDQQVPGTMILTAENYYSTEADRTYLSCSQFEDFLNCEAATVARFEGRYRPKKSLAFLVGNFFHSAFEGKEAHEAFIEEHKNEILKKNGELKADFLKAQEMISVALADKNIRRLVEADGEVEKIMTGRLFGRYPWKIRLDKYIPDLYGQKAMRQIIDWKTVGSVEERIWSDELHEKVSFVKAFRYLFRAAVYMEIEKQYSGQDTDPIFWLVCISKQDPPDKAVIALDGRRQYLDLELEKVKEKIWHMQQLKDGLAIPKRCGKCPYCRATKRITQVLDFWKLDPDDRPELEDDYAMDQEVILDVAD